MVINFQCLAQVGLDNAQPNDNAILDMKANDKGLLIPKFSTAQRFALLNACAPNCPNGLMVYDTVATDFFYIKSNKWFAISSFLTSDTAGVGGEPARENLNIVQNIGLNKTPNSGIKLDVNGNVRHRGATLMEDTLTVYNGNQVVTGNLTTIAGNLEIQTGYASAGNDISALNFSSNIDSTNVNGPIPRGGIIMWHGSSNNIPVGWGICNGTTQNGLVTPDLRERFIIGLGGPKTGGDTLPKGNDDYSYQQTGGLREVAISLNQMPKHTHSGSTNSAGSHGHTYKGRVGVSSIPFACDGSDEPSKSIGRNGNDPADYAGDATGDHKHAVNTAGEGSGDAVSNMPPYYALYYIIKL